MLFDVLTIINRSYYSHVLNILYNLYEEVSLHSPLFSTVLMCENNIDHVLLFFFHAWMRICMEYIFFLLKPLLGFFPTPFDFSYVKCLSLSHNIFRY